MGRVTCILVFVFGLLLEMGFSLQAEAANTSELSNRLNRLLIQEIHRVADTGKLLSNEEFGVGSAQQEIGDYWGEAIEGNSAHYPNKGVGFTFKKGIVTTVFPTAHDFYSLSDFEITSVLGMPLQTKVSVDETAKVYRYLTKETNNQLIFIIRKMDSDTYNQVDYMVMHDTDNTVEINDVMEQAMSYGLYYRKVICTMF